MALALALALIAFPAAAEPPKSAEPPTALKIDGDFAFDIMKPHAKCTKVTGALLAKLTRDYQCGPRDESVGTASGVKSVATCKTKKGDSEYMLFTTLADCKKERLTQLANGS